MKLVIPKGATSRIITVFIQANNVTTGAGLGSLTNASSIVGGYVREGSTGVALAVDEDVTTEGTYQAPSTAAHVRIGTPANMRTGTYELHFHNDLWATGAETVTITLGGATNMADIAIEVQLSDPVRGLGAPTALPNAAAAANGGLPTVDASNRVKANVEQVEATDATDYFVTLDDAILAAIAALNNLSAAGVWAAGTRTLTSGAGLNDLSAAQVQTAAAAALTAYDPPTQTELLAAHATTDALIATVDTVVDGIALRLPARITKNAALAAFPFKLVSSADHVTAVTGATVTATRSLDGAAFAACANAATEIGGGMYKIDLAAGDLNGTTVTLRFAATGADTREVTIVTQP